jgi:hypothetical protein
LSLDRTKAPYYQWRSGFEELRIRLYHQSQMMSEIETLLDGPDKIDHPSEGSKDATDSAAGAYVNAINSGAAAAMNPHAQTPSLYTGAPGAVVMAAEKPLIELTPAPEKRTPSVYKG